LFIFVFQTIWLFISELAGKDLDLGIILKFVINYLPTLIDKILPLTVLLSSILTFGSFAENYEFAAMKASGFSLQRAMRSLVVFCCILGVGTFFLANDIIPRSEQKTYNMRRNIAKLKPTAVIVEGVFTDIQGSNMNIKVEKKSGPKDQYLEDVIIHQKSSKNQQNTTVIRAKNGELISSKDADLIQLILRDGYYYEEVQPNKASEKRKRPFARAYFDTYTKNIDVSSLNNDDLTESVGQTTDKMKNVSRLRKDIDSLKDYNIKQVKAVSKNITIRMGAFPVQAQDSTKVKAIEKTFQKTNVSRTPLSEDSIRVASDLLELLPEWKRIQVLNSAKANVTNVLNTVNAKKEELEKRFEIYNRHILTLNKKYAFAFSCIILFFVGAPLGAIIRKGGLGLPMVIAILLFLTYHFIGVAAENAAKKGAINPAMGAWLSTLIMMPFSIYLTKRATADRGLMNISNKLAPLLKYFKRKKKEEMEGVEDQSFNELLEASQSFIVDPKSEALQKLQPLPNHQLEDVIQNFEQYDYPEEFRFTAIKILEKRGVGLDDLKYKAKLINARYQQCKLLIKRFKKNSVVGLVAYILAVLSPLIYLFVDPEKAEILVFGISGIFQLVVIYFLITTLIQHTKIHDLADMKSTAPWLVLLLLGIPLYFVYYIISRKDLKAVAKQIR
jgi:lipopolysaccharide export system permease protein